MGLTESTESGVEITSGYHVLQVQSNSPGEKSRLIPYFDFIVGANKQQFFKEGPEFADILRKNIDKPVALIVYNTGLKNLREVTLVPSNKWGGDGLAGISIRYCSFEQATEFVWHVMEVHPSSPASRAGLVSETDYIIGTPDIVFNSSEDFYSLIQLNEGKAINLYVFSIVSNSIRVIALSPNSHWGGEGSIGCNIAYGILHRIPVPSSITNIISNPSILNSQSSISPVSQTTQNTSTPTSTSVSTSITNVSS